MDKLKNLLIAIAGLVVMVGAIIAVTPATGQGQGGMNGKDVNVVNTPTVLAQQSGPWTVGISGTPTVRVGNTAQAPVLGRDVDEPARQPFQRSGEITFAAGEVIAAVEFTVPDGKRLVIEYVSANISSEEPLFWFTVRTSAGSSGGTHFFQPLALPNLPHRHVVSQQTRLYANPGSPVIIEARRIGTLNLQAASGFVAFSGHLVEQ